MNATQRDYALHARLLRAGIDATPDDARTLRRAERTLHRWHELECGDSNNWSSFAIERDDTGDPFMVHHFRDGKTSRTRTPDREAGALRRVRAVCERLGLTYYVQGDPRGCAMYVARPDAGMTDSNYSTTGVPCCE